METKKEIKVKDGHVLVLRTNDKNNCSYNGFQYPQSGWVEAPDWQPTPECGNGLHGALKGCGDGILFNLSEERLWMVLEVEEAGIIPLDGKVKFRGGTVVYVGDRLTATELIASVYGHIGIIGAIVTVDIGEKAIGGDYAIIRGGNGTHLTGGKSSYLIGNHESIVTGGDRSVVTGGDMSIVTGGFQSEVTGGDYSIVNGKDNVKAIGGEWSVVNCSHCSVVRGGDRSVVTGGEWSVVTGGDRSVVTGGSGSVVTGGSGSVVIGDMYSTLTGGDNSIIRGGERSSVRGGNGSVLSLDYYNKEEKCYKSVTAVVGEDGILPDTEYILDKNNQFNKKL